MNQKNVDWIVENKKPLPKLGTDTDTVYDLGESEKKGKRHNITEGEGHSVLYCPSVHHNYLHMINVPNKFALVCRGCREEESESGW